MKLLVYRLFSIIEIKTNTAIKPTGIAKDINMLWLFPSDAMGSLFCSDSDFIITRIKFY